MQGLVHKETGGTTRTPRPGHVHSSFNLCNSNLFAFLRTVCPCPRVDNHNLRSSVLTASVSVVVALTRIVQKGSHVATNNGSLMPSFPLWRRASVPYLQLNCRAFACGTVHGRLFLRRIAQRLRDDPKSTICRVPRCRSQRIRRRVLSQTPRISLKTPPRLQFGFLHSNLSEKHDSI